MTLRLTIQHDDSPSNPRTDFDNFGTMVCWHRRANLGDRTIPRNELVLYDSADEWLKGTVGEDAVVLPLYLYEHSGMTMSVSEFLDSWDSGKVGYIYATVPTILKEFDLKNASDITDEVRERAREIMKGEVRVYDEFLTGNVWGFTVEKEIKCECCGNVKLEHVDSCWGFFGDTLERTGIAEHLDNETLPLLEEAWKNRK